MLLHAVRGAMSIGSCDPSTASNLRQRAAILKHGNWKAVLLSRVVLEGAQKLRTICCNGFDFAPRLFKRVWGGSIGAFNRSDVWPAEHGRLATLGSRSVRDVVSRITTCGVPADQAPQLAAQQCRNKSWWPPKKNRPHFVPKKKRPPVVAPLVPNASWSADERVAWWASERERCSTLSKPKLCIYWLKQS